MKLSRFIMIMDAYGADPDHWPERERAEAVSLSRSSVVAARALARAREVDAVLRQADQYDLETNTARQEHLHARIMRSIQTERQTWFGRSFGIDLVPAQLWRPLAGMAFAAFLGVAVGMSGWMQLDSNGEPDDLVLSSIDIPATSP